jgi:hypothetical protein
MGNIDSSFDVMLNKHDWGSKLAQGEAHFRCIQEVRVWSLFGQAWSKSSHFLQVNTAVMTCCAVYPDQSFPGPFISLYMIILLISDVEFSGSCCTIVTTHGHSNLMTVV